jgi:hypothetical protein
LSNGVLASPPVVPSGARGYHKPNTQKSTMRIAELSWNRWSS